jgi:hypothetical protein
MAEKKKYRAKLREKFKARAERDEAGGRSLSVGDRNVKDHYGDYKEITIPNSQRGAFNAKITAAMKNRATEVLSGAAKTGLAKEKVLTKEAHKGLTGIRHPAQLIPAIKGVSTLAGIIKALTKK